MAARKKDASARARRNLSTSRATLQRPQLKSVEEFSDLTVAQLRAAIDEVNQTRPADQRVSKAGTKAALLERLAAAQTLVPRLPEHPPMVIWTDDGARHEIPVEWDPQTRAWWNDVWTSPMASEWDESDVHNVLVVALLYDDIWAAATPRARKEALAEYRLQRADLGLSPYSRRRLEWTIETAAEARDRGKRRRSGSPPAGDSKKRDQGKAADPRLTLVQ